MRVTSTYDRQRLVRVNSSLRSRFIITTPSQPDPTLRTLDALRREIEMLNESHQTRISSLEDLVDEKIRAVFQRIEAMEEFRQELKVDREKQVAAALEADKEATTKSETWLREAVEQLRRNIATEVEAMKTLQADVKERVTRIEAAQLGSREQREERRAVTAGQVAMVGAAVGLIMLLIAVISFMSGSM